MRLVGELPHYLARGCCPVPIPQGRDHNKVLEHLLAGEASETVITLIEQLCTDVRSDYNAAQSQVARWARPLRRAVRPLAVVPAYLRAATSTQRDVLRDPVDIAPLTRIWRIARGIGSR
jgi:phytoene/squalene synthetase